VALAIASGKTLAGAESCTGGLVAETLSGVPGASEAFLGCVVAYSKNAKTRLLGVDAGTISIEGAVSSRCAEGMATGAREAFGSDVSYAITGVAGPGPAEGIEEGTVWLAFSDVSGNVFSAMEKFDGGRRLVREQAAARALATMASLLRANATAGKSSS